MDFQFQGVRFVEGKLAVIGSLIGDNGAELPIYLPDGYAHTLGCTLIELAVLAKERETELRKTGQVLDVNTMKEEFARRLTNRMKLNGSTASVSIG